MRIFAAWIAIVGLLPPVLRMALKGTITADGAAICLLGAVVLLAFERRFRTGVLAVGGCVAFVWRHTQPDTDAFWRSFERCSRFRSRSSAFTLFSEEHERAANAEQPVRAPILVQRAGKPLAIARKIGA